MFDVSQNISYQLRKNLKIQSSLSLSLLIFTLEIIWKPRLILCSLIPTPVSYCATLSAIKRVHEAGYKLGHWNDAD